MHDLIPFARPSRVDWRSVPPLGEVWDGDAEDVCAYLFELSKRLDHCLLRDRGITCLFDVTGGLLSRAQSRVVGLLVAALVIDSVADVPLRTGKGIITIVMHRSGGTWHGTVSSSGLPAVRPPNAWPAEILRQLAQDLDAQLLMRTTADGITSSFSFAARSS